MKRLKNKAFTLIELIVVIAILGVLVLIAAPKFLGYTEDAKEVQIKNDVRVSEDMLALELAEDYNFIPKQEWESVETQSLQEYADLGDLYDRKGEVEEVVGGAYYKIPKDKVTTEIKGEFIAEEKGKVYYHEEGLGGEYSGPSDVYMATDEDFSGTTNGNFRYIGTGQSEIEIPHVIKGVPVTSYYQMFVNTGEDITKVVSTNPNVTNMSRMFYVSQTDTLDLSSFDTSNVNNMSYMFWGSKADTLDLSSFDTSNVTNMSYMFYHSQTTTLDLSSFDTSNVTDMNSMFRESKADTLDLSSFDTSNVTDMIYMFYNSQATKGYAKTTADANKFNNSSNKPAGLTFTVKPGESSDVYMATDEDFSGDTNGKFRYIGEGQSEIEIPHVIKGVPVTSYSQMFYNSGKDITKVVSTNPNVTNMASMFHQSQATTLDLSSLDTSNVTTMYRMFQSSQATSLDLSSFNTSNVTNMSSMFYQSQATTLDLSSFDTSNAINMNHMFFQSQATTLDLSSFDTSNITNMSSMFYGSQATTLDLSSLDTSNATNMSYMFYQSQATTLDLSSFDTSKLTSMSYMFYQSQATKGYARTTKDANKFNASSNKPGGLKFEVKQ